MAGEHALRGRAAGAVLLRAAEAPFPRGPDRQVRESGRRQRQRHHRRGSLALLRGGLRVRTRGALGNGPPDGAGADDGLAGRVRRGGGQGRGELPALEF